MSPVFAVPGFTSQLCNLFVCHFYVKEVFLFEYTQKPAQQALPGVASGRSASSLTTADFLHVPENTVSAPLPVPLRVLFHLPGMAFLVCWVTPEHP